MKRFARISSYVLLLGVIVACGLGVWQRVALLDWIYLRGYQPPRVIASLASDTGMTTLAQHLFYVNRPALEDKAAFNAHCPVDQAEQSVVLGCYRGDRQGIHLYNVTDSRLNGVEEATAAHEMLHQAYDRLSSAERVRIDKLLEAYQGQLTDQSIKDQLTTYQKTEPGQVDTELHSLFGTEVANLPPELETYYAKYFTDRTKVVAYYAQYEGEFSKRKTQIAQYDQQLSDMKTQIDSKQQDLSTRQGTLKTLRSQMQQELRANQIDEYNADVGRYNALVNAYNQELAATRALITEYNAIVEARNAIAVQEQQLQQALDSRPISAAS